MVVRLVINRNPLFDTKLRSDTQEVGINVCKHSYDVIVAFIPDKSLPCPD